VNTDSRFTYDRACKGYDEAFEQALLKAIAAAIAEASVVSDANVMAIRTGETAVQEFFRRCFNGTDVGGHA
jgi:ketosteroid isomerase-like protein